jgi:hypothetical protein
MLNTNLLPRPFSSDRPRVEGYTPLITGRITRLGRSRRNAWRAEVMVDGCAMTTSHHDTRSDAERWAEGMMNAYAKVHYVD